MSQDNRTGAPPKPATDSNNYNVSCYHTYCKNVKIGALVSWADRAERTFSILLLVKNKKKTKISNSKE